MRVCAPSGGPAGRGVGPGPPRGPGAAWRCRGRGCGTGPAGPRRWRPRLPARSRSRCSRSLASSIQPRPASGPGCGHEPAPRDAGLGKAAAAAQQPGELDRGQGDLRIAAVDRLAGDLEAGDRFVDAALVAEQARQPHEVAGRRPAPDLTLAVASFEVGQDAPERDHVLGVVAGHDPDRPGRAAAQERVVDGRDLPRRECRARGGGGAGAAPRSGGARRAGDGGRAAAPASSRSRWPSSAGGTRRPMR